MNSPNEERDPQVGKIAEEPSPQSPPPANLPPTVERAAWDESRQAPLAEATPRTATATQTWANRLRDPRRKSSALAILMSLMPGLGQIYVGHYMRGFIHILVIASLITLLANGAGTLSPLAGLGMAFFWMYNMVDAGRRATHFNQRVDAQAGGSLPEDIDFPSSGGSLAGGALLIALGIVFLMHTRFDWQFYWIEEWWPLGFMILGGYLVYKDRHGKKSDQ